MGATLSQEGHVVLCETMNCRNGRKAKDGENEEHGAETVLKAFEGVVQVKKRQANEQPNEDRPHPVPDK
eukprot:CAMPEP_0114571552 /NCGR_PEP_ID=MMETSP0114-20121206/17803_1 /TAXON_ID=31324 /ORGANISM="Goniomonas sp, Strain m" /LENGTH=68 /DNA_ID=CAMNT_0001758671 /DNA_START=871 /DNA_END=1077 /DNA_ORIENTATION=-